MTRKSFAAVRARVWADAAIAGETMARIGRREGVSGERVRQVIAEAGLTGEVHAARAAARAEAAASRAAESEARRKRLVATRRFSVAEAPPGATRRVSDADIVAALRVWLDAGGSGLVADWTGPPSAVTVMRRLGWDRAVEMAGGGPRPRRSPRMDRVSEEECLAALVAFLRDPAEVGGGAAPYAAWARKRGLPSDQTVRNRFGSWGAGKRLALEMLSE